jgi:hypothetical protein
MANPYTSQALSGYNSSPPTDDGSATAANQVTWAKHKTKLADPIKTLAEAINTETLAAFGLTFGQGILTKSADYTVAAEDRGVLLSVTGTTTITLPAVATAGDGFPLLIVNAGSAVVTIDGNSSETINGSTTITLYPGDYALLTCDSSVWSAAGAISESGSFTPTFGGFSSDPSSPTVNWIKRRGMAIVDFDFTTGVSNATSFTITNWPSDLLVTGNQFDAPLGRVLDNNTKQTQWGTARIPTAGSTLTLYPDAATGNWTASSNKGFDTGGSRILYPLYNPA